MPFETLRADAETAVADFAARGLLDGTEASPAATATTAISRHRVGAHAVRLSFPGHPILEAPPSTAPCGRARSGCGPVTTSIGVEFDTQATADAIRQRCGPGSTTPVGISRQRSASAPRRLACCAVEWAWSITACPCVIARRTSPSAVDTLATVVAGIATPPATGEVHVDARLLVRDGRAALLVLPAKSISTTARFANRGSGRWRAGGQSSTRHREVLTSGGRLPLVAIIVADPIAGASLDGSRRHLWGLGEGDRPGWTELLDRRGDLILPVSDGKAASTVAATLSA